MRATFTVTAGERVGFALQWVAAGRRRRPSRSRRSGSPSAIEDTVAAWRSWEAEHDIYEGPHRELVRLSSRVLKGLTYRPTGAIVAAPTTSLPETVGGERNWDYRYSWIRDASLTIEALYIGACSDEARGVRVVHDQLRRRTRERALAADHVRDRRRARPLRARAAAPARLARLRAGPGRQRRLGPDPARRLRRAAQLAATCTASSWASSTRRSSSSSPISRTRPRGAGARPTPACGRCAASRAITSHRKVLCWVALDRAIELAPTARDARRRRALGRASAT